VGFFICLSLFNRKNYEDKGQKLSLAEGKQPVNMNKKFLLISSICILFGVLFFAFSQPPGVVRFNVHIPTDSSGPFTVKAKDHKGKNVVATSGIITFSSGLDNDYYLADSLNKTAYFYIEAKLAKLLNLPQRRTPLNISIVIDRSGSMQGVKMGYAKKAAKGMIDELQPTDFVSVVMYDNAIDSVQEPIAVGNKDLIKAKIDKITPRGSTNLWGGTERGYEYALKNYKPGFINRVLLISDGLANIGITDSSVIRKKVLAFKDEQGITLSTFGVGLDYNETLMTDMAETGAGNYYFIDSPDQMMGMFQNEFNSMLKVIAQNAELRIRLPKGVKVDKTYPLPYTQIGDIVIIRLRDLFAEETKSILLRLRLQDRITGPLKFSATLSYTDALDGQQKSVTNENTLSPIKSLDPYLTHFNKTVIEETLLFTANENLEDAITMVDNRNFSGASHSVDANQAFLKANNYYVKDYRSLQVMDSINTNYGRLSSKAMTISPDSLKKVQKYTRALNYKVRNKKI
jgi:Ca-activated chloride channel family protein